MSKLKPYQIIAIICGLFLCFFGRFIPVSDTLSASGAQVLCIMVGALIMWLFVSVGWTSLAVVMAMALVPELGLKAVSNGSIGNDTVLYMILCFMLAKSLQVTGVAHRLATWFLTSKFSRKNPWNTIIMIFVAIFLLSSVLSGTSTVMIFLPILYEIFESLGYEKGKGEYFPAIMIASLSIVCQIAQATTPISHAMTLIGFSSYTSYTGAEMSFGQYVMVAFPVGLLTAVAWFLFCRFVLKPDVSKLSSLDYNAISEKQSPLTKQEKIAGGIYACVVILWLLPGISKYIMPAAYPVLKQIHQCYPPIIAIILLNFIEVDKKPVLSYKDALSAVPVGTLIFMGALLELGSALSNPDIGASKWLSQIIGEHCGNISPLAFVIMIGILAVILTNFMSNAISCAICMAIGMPLVLESYAGQINPMILAIMITIGINFAFATPPATPTVAIACDSGWISLGSLLKFGTIAAILGIIIMYVVGLPIANIVC